MPTLTLSHMQAVCPAFVWTASFYTCIASRAASPLQIIYPLNCILFLLTTTNCVGGFNEPSVILPYGATKPMPSLVWLPLACLSVL